MKLSLFSLASLACAARAVSIAEINGYRYLSPLRNQTVANVTGLVTARGPNGIFLRSTTPDSDDRSSESIYVFSNSIGSNLTVGDIISLGGVVTEFRSSSAYIFLTQISSPRNVRTLSRGNEVHPVVLGGSLSPPTEQFTSLDNGDFLSVPGNSSQIANVNPELRPKEFGLDFWESLSGELVTIRRPRALSKPNNFGDTWVAGDWPITGLNERGGVTMLPRDGNPETILIGTPLDGTRNPNGTKLGDELEEITGVITQGFGFYRILPRTALRVSRPESRPVPSTRFIQGLGCEGLSVGDYNVENLSPSSEHLPRIAAHIVNYLRTPSLIFLQEIQDDNGPTNDAVVSANLTLTRLSESIRSLSNVSYSFVDISPVDDQDGGQPGGNIRVAYLYNPSVIRLRDPNPGGPTDANEVLPGPALRFNPGRIDPGNGAAWNSSRKPLAALWETVDGRNPFFTVNVHWASKGGSSSIEGDARPPINGVVDVRVLQAEVTGDFISRILAISPTARVIASGDFNDFAFAPPLETLVSRSGLLDLDDVAGLAPPERYSYLFDMNCQQLDHMYVSPAIAEAPRAAEFEHVHINTWADVQSQVSDHDPSVAKLDVCEGGSAGGYGAPYRRGRRF